MASVQRRLSRRVLRFFASVSGLGLWCAEFGGVEVAVCAVFGVAWCGVAVVGA